MLPTYEIDKRYDYGIRVVLPSRWAAKDLGYASNEFGGSYQAKFTDSGGIASVLLIAANADSEKYANAEAWVTAVVINRDLPENLIHWYAGKGEVASTSIQTSEMAIGSGDQAKATDLNDLTVNNKKRCSHSRTSQARRETVVLPHDLQRRKGRRS